MAFHSQDRPTSEYAGSWVIPLMSQQSGVMITQVASASENGCLEQGLEVMKREY